jgi:galactose-1-phosphate uridylyltransferase
MPKEYAMSQQIDRETLAQILRTEDIETLPFSELLRSFREEITKSLPDGVCQVDPRNGDRILFASARTRRPHDNLPEPANGREAERVCTICQGNTTGVIDVADLSEGFTFINKNLYPILYPWEASRVMMDKVDHDPGPRGRMACGLHFIQWTSSLHDKDWHNMPLADCIVVMQRLAALERKLLTGSQEIFPSVESWGDRSDNRCFVLIIKNHGHLVGGSIAHGHQQIACSNILPQRFRDGWRFEQDHGETFSTYLIRENPADFLVRDYGSAVLLVPYFMRRPYDMMLLMKDASKKHLHELTEIEIEAVAEGWHDAIRAIRAIMPTIGRETAYNVVTHNGPGAGLYFEFLPYVQEIGGAEHLGLFICQGNPKSVTGQIREYLER